MELYTAIYLISLISTLKHVAMSLVVILLMIYPPIVFSGDEFGIENPKRLGKIICGFFVLSLTTAILMPSEKTSYLIAATYYGKKIATSEVVDERYKKALKILDQRLDSLIEDEGPE